MEPNISNSNNILRLWTIPFVIFLLINFFLFLGFDMLLPTFSLYLQENQAAKWEIAVIFSFFTISAVTFRLFAHTIAQRFGALKAARCGLFLCAIACGLYYFSKHTLSFIPIRIMHGAGFGLASALLSSLASQLIPKRRMGEGMGYLGLGVTVALGIGPLVGIWIRDNYNYAYLFSAIFICGVLSIIISMPLPKIELASKNQKEKKHKITFIETCAWKPGVLGYFYGMTISSIFIYLALYCAEKNLNYAAHYFAFSTIGTILARVTSGRIYDRYGHKYSILPGAFCILTGFIILLISQHKIELFISALLVGYGSGAIFPALQALTIESIPIEKRTEGLASIFNCFDLGIGSGSIFFGFLAEKVNTYTMVYKASSIIIIIFICCYLYFYPIKRKKKSA